MSDETTNADQQPTKRSLSEISHLFLTSVRDSATGGARPTRRPPGSFTPDVPPPPDFPAGRLGGTMGGLPDDQPARPPVGPVSALICPQLSGRQADRAREYARHLAAGGDRIGLVEVDAAECRVTCVELAVGDPSEAADPTTVTDVRPFADALEELAWDVDRWVLLLPNPRLPEARDLLRQVGTWTLLSTCDHDGVVSCYRAVKGLADVPRPKLSLALLDVSDADEAGRVYRKIAGVCEQFLGWAMTAEPTVEPAVDGVAEHVALVYRPRPTPGAAPQWRAVAEFLARAAEPIADPVAAALTPAAPAPFQVPPITPLPMAAVAEPVRIAEFVVPAPPVVQQAAAAPVASPEPIRSEVAMNRSPVDHPPAPADADEVTDLPGGQVTEAAVLSAVLSANGGGSLVECPVKPPSCPTATLAVGRDRRLVLLAVAKRGLGEVRSIASAYRWVTENRPLLGLALPQFAIDTAAVPHLRLVVDRSDAGADLLLPMADNANVTVQTYRTLKWAGRVGLLLEAA